MYQPQDLATAELDRLKSTEQNALSMSQYQLNADPDEVDLDLAAALIHWIITQRAEEVKQESGQTHGPDGAVLVFLYVLRFPNPADAVCPYKTDTFRVTITDRGGTRFRSCGIFWTATRDSAATS